MTLDGLIKSLCDLRETEPGDLEIFIDCRPTGKAAIYAETVSVNGPIGTMAACPRIYNRDTIPTARRVEIS